MAGRMEDKKVPRCSFCNKTQDQVRKLIAGPNAFICDECIGICSEIITEEFEEEEDIAEGIRLMKPKETKPFSTTISSDRMMRKKRWRWPCIIIISGLWRTRSRCGASEE